MFARPAAGLEGTRRGTEAQALLRNCVHCGFCLPACPTYRVTGNELDSPRGRIYLIKQLVEGAPASATTREHLDRCLTCRACERACPSGVEYGRLIDLGRELVEERVPRPLSQRALRQALVRVFSSTRLFTLALRLGQAARSRLPATLQARIPQPPTPSAVAPSSRHARRVVLLEGCVQPGLAPGINAAAASVLDRLGISVERVSGEQCCGALGHHLGHTDRALVQARRNVDTCCVALDEGAEAIVSSASACGLMVKDYGRLLADEPAYAARAHRVSAATRDLSEILRADDLALVVGRARGTGPRVAWQAPCTLQHGQRIGGRVEALLEAAGCKLVPTREATLCCGSAGTYSILQPELSGELRRRKLAALTDGQPVAIATANIGCLEHLRATSAVPVRHWIELVADALADPLPHRSGRVTLRRLCAGDLAAFQAYRHDPELGRYQGWSPMTDAEATAFLTEMSRAPLFAPGAWSQLGISEATDPSLIGDIGLFLAADSRQVEIGFTLGRRHQGQGLATVAVRAAIALAFEHTAAERVLGITDARNHASIRLLERAGLRRVETKATVFRGEPCLEHVYQLSRDEG